MLGALSSLACIAQNIFGLHNREYFDTPVALLVACQLPNCTETSLACLGCISCQGCAPAVNWTGQTAGKGSDCITENKIFEQSSKSDRNRPLGRNYLGLLDAKKCLVGFPMTQRHDWADLEKCWYHENFKKVLKVA